VHRVISQDKDGNMEVELTMAAFVEAIMASFESWEVERHVKTPVPDHMLLYKTKGHEEESRAAIMCSVVPNAHVHVTLGCSWRLP